MTESDFVILNKFGGDLKIQLRIKTRSETKTDDYVK